MAAAPAAIALTMLWYPVQRQMLPSSSCADRVLVDASAFARDDIHTGHDHAWRAETALQRMMLTEGFLHRVQLAVGGQPFDGRDRSPFAGQRQRRARLDRASVDMDHAGAALARVTAHMSAGEAQVAAQELDEQRTRFDSSRDLLAVHRHGYGGHQVLPSIFVADADDPSRTQVALLGHTHRLSWAGGHWSRSGASAPRCRAPLKFRIRIVATL